MNITISPFTSITPTVLGEHDATVALKATTEDAALILFLAGEGREHLTAVRELAKALLVAADTAQSLQDGIPHCPRCGTWSPDNQIHFSCQE